MGRSDPKIKHGMLWSYVGIWKRNAWQRRTINLSTNNTKAFHQKMKARNSGYFGGLEKCREK